MSFKWLNLISYELEACWHTQKTGLIPDGSLNSSSFDNPVCVGEYIPPNPFSTREELLKSLEDNYGDETSNCAGLHFHASFKNLDSYSKLMEQHFYDYFMEFVRKWAKDNDIVSDAFHSRLENKNRYCRAVFQPNLQVTKKRKDDCRYTHLNYCFALHETLEIRLFPTFQDVEVAKSAANCVIDCIESYLDANPPIPLDRPDELIIDENEAIIFNDEVSLKSKKTKIKIKPYSRFDPDYTGKNDLEEKIVRKRRTKAEIEAANAEIESQRLATDLDKLFEGVSLIDAAGVVAPIVVNEPIVIVEPTILIGTAGGYQYY